MCWFRKNIIFSYLVITSFAVIMNLPAFALVELTSSPNSSGVVFERNSQNGNYVFKVVANPKANAQVSAVEANLTYDNTIFTLVSITDQINASSGAIWETSVVNAAYQVSGNRTTVKYLKASTDGDTWSFLSSGGPKVLYTLTFQVKNNAPLGATFLVFDGNFAKVQDANLGNVTGTLRAVTLNIVLDSTAPISSITNGIVGNYYKTAQSVDLGTNEQGHAAQIHYTLDNTNPRVSATTVHGADPINGILISSVANGMKVTTLNFYASDLPVGAPSNVEAITHTHVYHIDTQLPSVNILAHDSGPVGVGYSVRVTFNVNDNSGFLAGNPTVKLGNQNYTRISGSGIGTYVYSRTITGTEGNGDLSIIVTDLAGNTLSYLLNNAVTLDLNPPTFVITPLPNPVTVNRRVTINVLASKTLEQQPNVSLGGVSANWVSQAGNNYVFTAIATANGWLANLPWVVASGVDSYAPTVNLLTPLPGAINVHPVTALHIDFSDIGSSGIAPSSLQVTINNGTLQSAIRNGVFQSGFSGVQNLLSGILRVTINHTVAFNSPSLVTVDLKLKDVSGNTLNKTYVFAVALTSPVFVSANARYTGIDTYRTQVFLAWSATGPTANTQYQLKYIQGNAVIYQGSATQFTHLNLPDETMADYVVRAINSGITGNYSTTLSVMLPDAHVDAPPTKNGYVFDPATPTKKWSPTANAILYRDYSNRSATMAAMVIDGAAMGPQFNFNAIDFSDIVITLNAKHLPVVRVPLGSQFGSFVNNSFASGNIKQIPIRFGGINQKGAIITVDLLGGAGVVPITKYGGGERSGLPLAYQGRLSNFYYSPTQNAYLFKVNRFSEYGIATVSTVNFGINSTQVNLGALLKIPIRVRDSNGSGVENAPVTLNVLSGSGTILTAMPAVTDVSGFVTFNFQTPASAQTVILRANVDGHFTSPDLTLTMTANGPDIAPPVVSNLNPANGAIKVNESTALSFNLSDSQSGVNKSSVYLRINNVNVTPSMTGPISQLAVLYKPSVAFGNGSTVNVTINARDVSGNVLRYHYAFKVINLDDWSIGTPLAVPTIFDPYTQSTDLLYNLQKSEDILLRIYDLSGRRIFERYFSASLMGARAGNNRIPWTGRDDLQYVQSNGVYFFYIVRVSDKRVLGRGKAVISKSH
jgi:hypothetical protein